MNPRFTIDGCLALEAHLDATCSKVVDGILTIVPGHKIEAVLLAGGYGRGEGGVLKSDDGEHPYNDLEFYVCINGSTLLNERKYGTALHHLGEQLSSDAKVEVEFKIVSLKKIEQSEPTMFLYDLAMGHRTLAGNDRVLQHERFRNPSLIPLHEATRLLMNRCSGLLFAQERLQRGSFTVDDADFVGRNQAKAQLALGDVVLVMKGIYHWSCRERNKRLRQLADQERTPFLKSLYCHHNLGAEFKLHPRQREGPRELFQPLQCELCTLACQLWLQLEARRLQHSFDSPRAYAMNGLNKCPETHAWRNRLVNGKRFGLASIFDLEATRYPRERLLNSLPLLLWDSSLLVDATALNLVKNQLRTEASTFHDLVDAYQCLWKHFN